MSKVVKYREIPLGDFSINPISETIVQLHKATISQIDTARDMLFGEGLIGRINGQPAHGNICMRIPEELRNYIIHFVWGKFFKEYHLEYTATHGFQNGFFVTASQTGDKKDLTPEDYVVILHYSPKGNYALRVGQQSGSSEVPTLAAVLMESTQQIPPSEAPFDVLAEVFDINAVAHGHDRSIWMSYKRLGLPSTKENVLYGTPEMCAEVRRLFKETNVMNLGAFVMLGHKNGVVAFEKDPIKAAQRLIDLKNLAEKN